MSEGKGQEWTLLWCNEDSVDLNGPLPPFPPLSPSITYTYTQSFIIYQGEQHINAAEDLLVEK